MRTAVLLVAMTALSACNAEAPPAHTATPAVPTAPAVTPLPSTTRDAVPSTPATTAPATATTPTPSAGAEPASGPPPAFADIPWKVSDSPGGQAGAVYTFGSDGTLTVAAPGGTPSTGRWSYAGGKLTLVEDGVAYPTDIVSLDDMHFVIRSHNPGGTVEIAMVPAR